MTFSILSKEIKSRVATANTAKIANEKKVLITGLAELEALAIATPEKFIHESQHSENRIDNRMVQTIQHNDESQALHLARKYSLGEKKLQILNACIHRCFGHEWVDNDFYRNELEIVLDNTLIAYDYDFEEILEEFLRIALGTSCKCGYHYPVL